jgi:hypothetical protein
MIVSHILGGLGNQMFQYASARAVAYKHNQILLLDLKDFNDYPLHNGFELGRIFNVEHQKATTKDISKVLWMANSRNLKRVFKHKLLKYIKPKRFIVEYTSNYCKELNNAEDNIYLYGYWQNERYFKPIEHLVRKDFNFKLPLSGLNLELAKSIKANSSISVHVRRGDYLSDKKTAALLNVCTKEYYFKAINLIAMKVKSPTFYVFSDDIEWVKQNIPIQHPCVYVNHNHGVESYIDMQLMSLCKHNIIANSSFSWWGAWLNNNPEKIVYAPKIWFLNSRYSEMNIVPDSWNTL